MVLQTPLWPQPLPIIGVTGEYKAGKTLLALTIDPPRTLYFDTEKSGETYEALGLGFRRIDVWTEMLRLMPDGHKPVDMYLWWLDAIHAITPGQYTVIALDTVSEIESGLVDWVGKNPAHFGHTMAQYQRMEGIMWGDVKEHWKGILSELASRCTTFVFTSHLRDKWSKQGPTNKRVPKGKETLMELASLYLMLDRRPDANGLEPTKPAATVLKSRLVSRRPGADPGSLDLDLVPTLPARLPVATPAAIRAYMLAPAGARTATTDESVPTEHMGDDERLRLQAEIATANRDTEAFRLEQQARRDQATQRPKDGTSARAMAEAAAAAPATINGLKPVAAEPPAQPPTPASRVATPDLVTPAQIEQLVKLKADLEMVGLTHKQWLEYLEPFETTTARSLTCGQARQLIDTLKAASQVTVLADPSTGNYPPAEQQALFQAAAGTKGGEPPY